MRYCIYWQYPKKLLPIQLLDQKSEKMLEIMQSENIKLEPWMIDLISQAYHNIDAVANKLMFGQKKD